MSLSTPPHGIPLPPGRVVVTGGAGFIGSHLVDALVTAGREVCVIDDLSSGVPANLADRLSGDHVRLIVGSVLDRDLVDAEVRGAGTVFHLAASVGVGRVVADPLGSLRTNLAGTENVLAACAQHGCGVVLASSSEVYGKTTALPMSESGDRLLGPTSVPRWSYAAAKAVDEHLAFAYADRGLRATVVRYFNSYGPRMRADDASVVAAFLRRALADEPLTVHGDGSQTRCFTYVADTVRGTLLAAATDAAQGLAVNIGTDDEISVAALAEMVAATVGAGSPIRHAPHEAVYGPGFEDVPRRVPDLRRARSVLGWAAEVPLAEGLKRTAAWWGEQP